MIVQTVTESSSEQGSDNSQCRNNRCNRPVAEGLGDYCVFHAPVDSKPGFWDKIAVELYPSNPKRVFSPYDQLGDPFPGFDNAEIDLRGFILPSTEVPGWVFLYKIRFEEVEALGDFLIRKARIPRPLHIVKSKFHGPVCISDVEIEVSICFEGCDFQKDFNLRDAKVKKLECLDSRFHANASFHQIRELESCTFRRYTVFGRDFRFVNASLAHNRPQRCFLFDTVRFHRTRISFEDRTRLEEVCDFHACNWIKMRGKEWPDRLRIPGEVPPDRQEEQFRQLRLYYARAGNAVYANEFAYSETETQRLKLKPNKWWKFWLLTPEYCALTIYKYLSFYNSSYLWPVLWGMILILGLASLHLVGGFVIPASTGVQGHTVNWDFAWSLPNVTKLAPDFLESIAFVLNSVNIRSGELYQPASFLSRIAKVIGQTSLPALMLLFAFAVRRRFVIPEGLK